MTADNSMQWNNKAHIFSELVNDHDVYEHLVNMPAIQRMIPNMKYDRGIVFGAGTGTFATQMSKCVNTLVLTDVSPQMIKICRQSYPHLESHILDLEIPFPIFSQKFDLIFCKLVFMFVDDLEFAIKESAKIMNQGGHLIVSVYHPIYWYNEYVKSKYGFDAQVDSSTLERGYFSECTIRKAIAARQELTFDFFHRKLDTYVNCFIHGGFFTIQSIDEPNVPNSLIDKYPESFPKLDYPLRLNFLLRRN
mgnify:CR=1 FL=1